MSNDNAGRTPRTTSGAPMGSMVAIVVTVIAVALGLLVLNRVNDGSKSTSGGKTDGTSTSSSAPIIDPGSTEATTATTQPPPLVTSGTKVQVANASHQNKVAAAMSALLATKGFTMADAVSASTKQDKTTILYNQDDTNAKAVADSLATLFPGATVIPQGLPVPTATGAWAEGSAVVVMLGDDYAGKTLDEIAGKPTTGTTALPTTTVPGAVTATS